MKVINISHTEEEAKKVFSLWYKGAIILEVAFLFEVGMLFITNSFFHFALALFCLISTIFIHLAIQLGDIQLKLGEISNKKGEVDWE